MSELIVYKASAGSGKTFRLAVHFIKLLLAAGTPDEYAHILGVTFTNKATTEMKDRILSQLYGIANRLPSSANYFNEIRRELAQEGVSMSDEEIRRRCKLCLTSLLHDYNHFRIQTIDSFFQTILKGMAHELGLSANLQVDLSDQEVLAAAVDSLIDKISNNGALRTLLYNIVEQNLEDDASWDITSQLNTFGKAIFKEDYLRIKDALAQSFDKANITNEFLQQMRQLQNSSKQELQDLSTAFESCLANGGFSTADISNGNYLDKLLATLKNGDVENVALNATMQKWIENPDAMLRKADKQRAELQTYANAISSQLSTINSRLSVIKHQYYSAQQAMKHVKLIELLQHIDKEVADINAAASRFNLSKTQILLHEMINGSDAPFVFEKIGAQLHHILIDEFQDTSQLQWSNFLSLLLDTYAKGGKNLLVGDVKQSIYRWRGGDWRTLGSIHGNQPGIHVETLDTNRRSMRHVVDFNNNFFQQAVKWIDNHTLEEKNLLQPEVFSFTDAYEGVSQQVPPEKPEEGYVYVKIVEKAKDDEPAKEQIINDLKAQIQLLHEGGLPYEKMTILVRYNRESSEIIQAFANDPSMPKLVSDEAFLFSSSEVVTLLIEMLRMIDNANNSISSFYLQQHDIDIEQLKSYATAEKSQSLYELIETLYRDFNLQRIQRQDSYLFGFLDAVMDFMHNEGADIHAFLQYWDETLSKQPIPSAQVEGIRIVSIHKSKGLEYHTVFIPFATWDTYSYKKHEGDFVWCKTQESPYDKFSYLPVTLKKSSAESIFYRDYAEDYLMSTLEELNALYVAFTRCRCNLFVWSEQVGPKSTTLSMKSIISACVPQDVMPYEVGKPVFTYEQEDTKSDNRLLPDYAPHPISKQSFVPSLTFRQSNQSEQFCAQMQDIDYQSDQQKQQGYLQTGRLLHYVLQHIQKESDIPTILDALESEGVLTRDTRSKLENLLQRGMKNKDVKDWFSGNWQVFNERAILMKKEKGAYTTRRPDRVMMNADASQIIVVDFKFGTMYSDYKEQVLNYVALLQQIFPAATITGYLWFVYANKVVDASTIQATEGVQYQLF